MKKIKFTCLALATSLFLNSCASIVSKSSWPISINSTPNGAVISIMDAGGTEVFKGNTPTAVVLKSGAGFFKKASYTAKFILDGYETKVVPINFSINGWYFGNLLLGGIIGMLIVDPATGAMYKVDNEFMSEALQKTGSVSTTKPSLQILDINSIPENWKEHLEKVK